MRWATWRAVSARPYHAMHVGERGDDGAAAAAQQVVHVAQHRARRRRRHSVVPGL